MRGTWAAVAFLGLTIGYGMVLGGQAPVFFDSLTSALGFGIESIEINGLVEANSEEIADRIDVGLHSSLLLLDAEHARSRVAEIPWVADVEVKKVYPNRLVVNLVERRAYALWQDDGQLHVVDKTGAVMTSNLEPQHAQLPLVVGTGANLHVAEAVALLNSQPALKSRIKAAQFVAERRWNLITDAGVEIRLPEDDPLKAYARVAELDQTKRLLDRDIVAIDMRATDRILIRLSDAAADQRRELMKSRLKKKASDT
ncbi:MAG: cell division protein FtsQ/DivIB [Ancalomicrobiaceae bacterium]|nr:cell division protein FtsQ/DivIB [Ancalomicrobiaceae bacterium]